MRLICDWSANEAEECDEQSLGINDSGSQSTQTSKHAKPVSSKRQLEFPDGQRHFKGAKMAHL